MDVGHQGRAEAANDLISLRSLEKRSHRIVFLVQRKNAVEKKMFLSIIISTNNDEDEGIRRSLRRYEWR